MASQLQGLDNRLGNEPGKSAGSELTSSEMQKLASLGYVGLQKGGAGVNAATGGTDPKELIAVINKTLAALLELDDGKPDKAMPLLREVLAGRPTIYLAQYGMGFAMVQQGQYAEAIGYLHKAIELQPDSAFAHYMMGLSLMKTGDFKASAIHLEIASGRLPAFSAAHSMLADVYEHLGRSQDSAREQTRAAQTKD
ncbi:MAG TPA: tetratricopeptide repeat protein [Terriglobales bacterium]|nr:tetratricopeptide repeat protein [Terriglobales bacterium]